MKAKRVNGGRTFLEDLGEELVSISVQLSRYATEERARRQAATRERITAPQLHAILEARHARTERLGMDLAHPGWSLLLELFRASLEKAPVRLTRLAAEAHVPSTTALRWVERFIRAGLVRREAPTQSDGPVRLALTHAGAEAMEDYFVSVQLGWAEADGPKWSV